MPARSSLSIFLMCLAACSGVEPVVTSQGVQYASGVVSFTPGDKGGYNADRLPAIVLGPPEGAGCCAGSLDVLSLGNGGEIVLSFDHDIVDGDGADFVVYENPFEVGGDASSVVAEPAEVAVSVDGRTWTVFPCVATTFPYGSCAGWHPVYASKAQPVNKADPSRGGGDAFDLAAIGVPRARYVRIRDMNGRLAAAAPTAGFDLDAVAVLHAAP